MALSPYYAGREWPAYEFREWPKEVGGIICHTQDEADAVIARIPSAAPPPTMADLQKQLAALQAQLAAQMAVAVQSAPWSADTETRRYSDGSSAIGPRPLPDQSPNEQRDALLARAEELGLDVDKRWGVDRLRQAVQSAEQSDG